DAEAGEAGHRRVRGDDRRARRAGSRARRRRRRVDGVPPVLAGIVKLATLKDGTRDGRLMVVSRDLRSAALLPAARNLQAALDDWRSVAPHLEELTDKLNSGRVRDTAEFQPRDCHAPLPRAYQWADGSAYVNHVELVRKARGAEMPATFWTDPLMY